MRFFRRLAIRFGLICPHFWRPAKTHDLVHAESYGRYCPMCERFESLTEADYYARFGSISRTAGPGKA